ncbi:MAG: carbonic anhydrase [Clostridium sp.]|nr:carbonic anhydrase [Clostridium sp.]
MINEILEFNRRFVAEKGYERFLTDKYPNRRIAIVTCMDTRLVELLPAALGIRNGDVKIIKNAGATITNPFDSTMRSLLVAVYELGVNEIMVIGHTNCGVQGMNAVEMLHLMKERGIPEENITLMKHCGIDLDSWLHGFDDTADAVNETVDLVRNHPLMARDVTVKGYIMDTETGLLTLVTPNNAKTEN